MTQYKITTPVQTVIERNEPPKTFIYDSEAVPNKSIWGVKIKDGVGLTDNAEVAVELFDMGYQVEPDPHPEAQQIARQRLIDEDVAKRVQARALERDEQARVEAVEQVDRERSQAKPAHGGARPNAGRKRKVLAAT